MATSFHNLGLLYYVQGKYSDAESFYQRALTIREKALAPDHPDLVTNLESYADVLRKTGRGAEADEILKRAKAIRRE